MTNISEMLNILKTKIRLVKILIFTIIIISLWRAVKFDNKMAALGTVAFLLMIPIIVTDTKTF